MKARSISSNFIVLFMIFLPISLVVLVSCNKSGSDDDGNPAEKIRNFVSFSLIGPIVNGDFSIKSDDENTGIAAGSMVLGTEKIRLTYNDLDQDLSFQLLFPKKSGTYDVKDFLPGELDGGISVFVSGAGRIADTGSITVSELKSTGTGNSLKLSVKGTFQGVVVNFDFEMNEEFRHEIWGEFEYNSF